MSEGTGEEQLHEENDVRVSIPVWQHLLLHELKVLTDRTISETVQQALTHEFERLADEEASPVSAEELQGEGGEIADLAAPIADTGS